MREVTCPLLNQIIDGDDLCFWIADAAEGWRKIEYVDVPEKIMQDILKNDNWREICNNCPNHLD